MKHLVLQLKILIKRIIDLDKTRSFQVKLKAWKERILKNNYFSLKVGASPVTKGFFLNMFIVICGRKDSIVFTNLEMVMKWKEFWILAIEQEHKHLETESQEQKLHNPP